MSRSFIINSVKRLEKAGFLNITHSKKKHICNQYHFGELPRYERIPYELFDADLSANQKAMLLCIRQFFNEGKLTSTYTITGFAKLLGISYKTVYSQFISLVDKGYIDEKHIIFKGKTKNKNRLKLTEKIDWHYDYSTYMPKQQIVYPKLRVA